MQPRTRPSRSLSVRAQYARTTGNFLVNDPDGFPSDFPPALWWYGTDTGGGAHPIGPNGPWSTTAAAVPAVLRATSLIAGPLTAAPFRVLEGAYLGAPSAAAPWLTDPTNLRGLQYVKPVPAAVSQLPRAQFWSDWIRSAIWFGIGAIYFREGADRQPLAGTLVNINPHALSTRVVDGALCWVLGEGSGTEVEFLPDGRLMFWDDEAGAPMTYRLVVLRNPHSPVDEEGRSRGVFELAPNVFGLAGQIETYASGTFRSGVPAGYLKVTNPGLTPDAAQQLKARWLQSHGGDRRSIAVLNSTTEFVPLSLSPVDAALAEVKRLNLGDIAFAFGLDPATLGSADSATYSNIRDAWENHRDFGLAPWIAGVQDTLSALVPGTASVVVNLDGFANPPAGERFAAYQVAISAGILSVAEVRALEGLPPAEVQPATPAPEQPTPTPIEPEPVPEPEPEAQP